MNALIRMPARSDRFIRMPAGKDGAMRLDYAGASHGPVHRPAVSRLHPSGQGAFRIIRDSELEIEEEAEDLVRCSKPR